MQREDSLTDAVAVLSGTRLKKVPVLDGENGRVIGVVSRSAIRRLALANAVAPRDHTDPALVA